MYKLTYGMGLCKGGDNVDFRATKGHQVTEIAKCLESNCGDWLIVQFLKCGTNLLLHLELCIVAFNHPLSCSI